MKKLHGVEEKKPHESISKPNVKSAFSKSASIEHKDSLSDNESQEEEKLDVMAWCKLQLPKLLGEEYISQNLKEIVEECYSELSNPGNLE